MSEANDTPFDNQRALLVKPIADIQQEFVTAAIEGGRKTGRAALITAAAGSAVGEAADLVLHTKGHPGFLAGNGTGVVLSSFVAYVKAREEILFASHDGMRSGLRLARSILPRPE